MGVNIAWQVWALGLCALGGMALGLVYDAGRLIRGRFPIPGITAVCDILFWLFATLLAALIVMRLLGGELRLFALVGLLLGLTLYLLTLGPLVLKVGYAVIDGALFVLKKLCLPFVLVGRTMRKIFRYFRKTSKNLFSFRKKYCMINSEYRKIEGGLSDEQKARKSAAQAGSAGAGAVGGDNGRASAHRHRRGDRTAQHGAAGDRPPEA